MASNPTNHQARAAALFQKCPECGAPFYRHFDQNTHQFAPRSDSGFLYAVLTWVLLAAVAPALVLYLWNPGSEPLGVVARTLIQVLAIAAELSSWSRSLFLIAIAVVIILPVFWGRFACCPACQRGFVDGSPLKARSFGSILILALMRFTSLRFGSLVGVAAYLTTVGLYFLVLVFVLANPKFLMLAVPYASFGAAFGVVMHYFGNNEDTEGVAFWILAVSFALLIWVAGMSGFVLILVGIFGVIAYKQNDLSEINGLTLGVVRSAFASCAKRLPLIFAFMIPGLALKSGVDWASYRALGHVEDRALSVDSITVPTIKREPYPWYSPLRWAGVPMVVVTSAEMSVEQPKRLVLYALRAARTLVDAVGVVTFGMLALLFVRAIICMFVRELVAAGASLNAYVPAPRQMLRSPVREGVLEGGSVEVDLSTPARISIASSMVIDPSEGTEVFFKRTLSPTGGVPSVELVLPFRATLTRLLNRCLLMDSYSVTDTSVQLNAIGGHRFARWDLREDEVIVLDFTNVVGWTTGVRFDTVLCLQIGMLAQGRLFANRAYGPGTIIFELKGDPPEWQPGENSTFMGDRLVACRLNVEMGDARPQFQVAGKGGWLNGLLGTVSQKPSADARLLLDPVGRRSKDSNPILSLLRHTYRLF